MFKGRKIKNLIERYALLETPIDDTQILSEFDNFGKQSIQYVIEAFQRRGLSADKAQYIFKKMCDESFVENFVSLIGDPYDEIRRVAKGIILEKWRQISLPLLIEKLEEPDPYTRNNAAELLASLKDSSCVIELISLFNKTNPNVKRNIVKILGRTGGQQAKKLIMSALNDESWDVCHSAVKCLGEMKAPESVLPLIEKLKDDDPRIKRLALDALGSIGDKRAALPFVDLLKDDDLIIRQKATEYLVDIGDADIVEHIIALMRDEDVNVRRCAVEVLNNLKDPRTADALMKAIKDSDWWVRQIATDSLTNIKGDNIVNGFIALAGDSDESLRRCAVEFFIKVPVKSALEQLIVLLDDPDWWVREKAITALGMIKDKRAIIPIAEMIHDEEVKSVVPAALATIGGEEALKFLKEYLFDENKRIRLETLTALEEMKAVEVLDDIQECLNDREEEVRNHAVNVIKAITGKSVKKEARVTSGHLRQPASSGVKPCAGEVLRETILVLDLCKSSEILASHGENFLQKLMKAIKKAAVPIAEKERYQFMKMKGHAFLITFPEVTNAVRFATEVLKTIKKYNEKTDTDQKIDLRFAINQGEIKFEQNGDRSGLAINMTFRINGIEPDGLIPMDDAIVNEEIPLYNRIFVTENAEKKIKDIEGIKTGLIGLFELNGIAGLHKIYRIT